MRKEEFKEAYDDYIRKKDIDKQKAMEIVIGYFEPKIKQAIEERFKEYKKDYADDLFQTGCLSILENIGSCPNRDYREAERFLYKCMMENMEDFVKHYIECGVLAYKQTVERMDAGNNELSMLYHKDENDLKGLPEKTGIPYPQAVEAVEIMDRVPAGMDLCAVISIPDWKADVEGIILELESIRFIQSEINRLPEHEKNTILRRIAISGDTDLMGQLVLPRGIRISETGSAAVRLKNSLSSYFGFKKTGVPEGYEIPLYKETEEKE